MSHHYLLIFALLCFGLSAVLKSYLSSRREKAAKKERTERAWRKTQSEFGKFKKRLPKDNSHSKDYVERSRPFMAAYAKWHALYWSEPSNWPPGELAMRKLIYQPEKHAAAYAELQSLGFAEASDTGRIQLNDREKKLRHDIYMSDR